MFVDLGSSPLCQTVIAPEQLDEMEPHFPLHVLVCGDCFLVQLREYVSPENIFREYAYFSSYSTSWVAHAKAYCEMIQQRLGLGADSLVVEIASNDGYLLQHFLPLGVPVLGVEPAANVAKVAIDKGIPTWVDFFGFELAGKLAAAGKQADLIVGNNVLAQVPQLNDFVSGLARLLKPEGVITLEFPHLERLMAENQFDTIYHEHFSYFSLVTIERLAARHGLRLIDVEELPTHGGSLRVYLAHAGSARPTAGSVPDLLARERHLGFHEIATYASFAEQVRRTKRRLLSFLIEAKNAGKTICGYGAPGKGNTLLNYCGIGPDFLDFTVDRNPYKQGHFTPGMRIPIHPVDAIDAARPDYILILPWNLKDEIVQQMRHVAEWGAKFIVPIPEVTVIDPKELEE
ncbi:methyltransferase domain-containing protein [Inquilinus limosus]|uniref:methyltransferase domain-containing protein n=1 Tax=Inquilinus limosus TaxID=171674 RepID=UPI003F5CEE6C